MKTTTWKEQLSEWNRDCSPTDDYRQRDLDIQTAEVQILSLANILTTERFYLFDRECDRTRKGLELVWGEEDYAFYRDGFFLCSWYHSCRGEAWYLHAKVGHRRENYTASDSNPIIA